MDIADGDEPARARPGDAEWQHHRYLVGHRLAPYPKAITFNSNGTDDNVRSTGAKDDLDIDRMRQAAADQPLDTREVTWADPEARPRF